MLTDFADLRGHTLRACYGRVGDSLMTFVLDNGEAYMLYHDQDCCESVYIEDICGDTRYLVGTPLIFVEESTSDVPDDAEDRDDLCQWTFYKFATHKGYVTVRWYGGSNGYYSVEVSFKRAPQYDEKVIPTEYTIDDGPDVG